MKMKKIITHAPNVSHISGFQAFMADKQPHSLCGNGIKSPIPIAAKSENIDKRHDDDATMNGTSGHFFNNHRRARPPP